jgi:lipoprotein NlpD
MKYGFLLIILINFWLQTGCASRDALAPVKDRNQPSSTKVGVHIVAPGETLYSISWRYNLNYRALAKYNKINNLYTIYPGQKLILKEDFSPPVTPSPPPPLSVSSKVNATNTNSQVVKDNSQERSKKQSLVVDKKPTVQNLTSRSSWVWPTNGHIAIAFSAQKGLNKGVDITGKLGQPVVAASSGKVVYSGDGLRGYGKLIILKHSASFLSAYAHNKRLSVKEGDVVKQGQKIAEMGRSGTDKVKLHFEIRRDGKPVDPLKYLPSQKK